MGEPVNSSFSQSIPGLQIAWDATSLGKFKTCPMKYYYEIVQGWTTARMNVNLFFGQLLHIGLEEYDKQRAYEVDHKTAQRAALERVLHNMGSYERDENGELSEWRPWQSEDKYKTPHNLIRTVVWYTEQFKDDPCETIVLRDGTPAVELPFQFSLPDFYAPSGEQYIFCGHIDRIVKFQDQLWVMDRKTTKSTLYPAFFEKFSPDNQMSMYTAAGKICFEQPVRGVMIDGMQIAVGFTAFQRGFAHRSEKHLEEFLEDAQHYIKMAEHFVTKDFWPMNDSVCDLYGGCSFRNICATEPSLRRKFLASNFTQGQWDPLKIKTEPA